MTPEPVCANQHLAGAGRRPELAAKALGLKLKGSGRHVESGDPGSCGHLNKSS